MNEVYIKMIKYIMLSPKCINTIDKLIYLYKYEIVYNAVLIIQIRR